MDNQDQEDYFARGVKAVFSDPDFIQLMASILHSTMKEDQDCKIPTKAANPTKHCNPDDLLDLEDDQQAVENVSEIEAPPSASTLHTPEIHLETTDSILDKKESLQQAKWRTNSSAKEEPSRTQKLNHHITSDARCQVLCRKKAKTCKILNKLWNDHVVWDPGSMRNMIIY